MRIESVEWSTYKLSPEKLVEQWAVAEDVLAVVGALMVVESAEGKDTEAIEKLQAEKKEQTPEE